MTHMILILISLLYAMEANFKVKFNNSKDKFNTVALDQLISKINVLGVRNISGSQCSKIFSKYTLSTYSSLDELYKKILFESIWHQTNNELDKARNILADIKNKILKFSDITIIINIFKKLRRKAVFDENILDSIFNDLFLQNLDTNIDLNSLKHIIISNKKIFVEYDGKDKNLILGYNDSLFLYGIYKLLFEYSYKLIKDVSVSNSDLDYFSLTDRIRFYVKRCLNEISVLSHYRKENANLWEFLESEFYSFQEFIYEAYNGCELIIQRAIEIRYLNNINDNFSSKEFFTYYK